MSWLDYETHVSSRKRLVTKLRCSVCKKYKEVIAGRRNFSERWIVGADSVRTSNIRDHSHADQHIHAMSLLKREQAKASNSACCSYSSPIAYALSKLPDQEKAQLRVKFDIAYFIAREKMSFSKYLKLSKLEAKHGVPVGTAYTNDVAGKTFIHYVAEAKRQELAEKLVCAKYFSLLMDGSTDSSNTENEVLMVVYCDTQATTTNDEMVHTKTEYFCVLRPSSDSASGLLECVNHALSSLGITEISATLCPKLVGFGTDGAAANVARHGLKGLVEQHLEWIFWMWCLAHQPELSVKGSLKGTAFDAIDKMLLRLYYIYEKSPKNHLKNVES